MIDLMAPVQLQHLFGQHRIEQQTVAPGAVDADQGMVFEIAPARRRMSAIWGVAAQVLPSPAGTLSLASPVGSTFQSIDTLGGIPEKGCAFVWARALRQPFEGVPCLPVAVGALVDGEVAFEHAASRTEGFNAGFDIPTPGGRTHLGRRRIGPLLAAEAIDAHTT